MTTINIIILAAELIVFVAELAIALRVARERNQLYLDLEDLDIERKALQKKRNDLDLWERQVKGDVDALRHESFFETVDIPADKGPSKGKARKLLASRFGYDVIDLIKIHESKNADGSATYKAEFNFMHNGEGRK